MRGAVDVEVAAESVTPLTGARCLGADLGAMAAGVEAIVCAALAPSNAPAAAASIPSLFPLTLLPVSRTMTRSFPIEERCAIVGKEGN